MARYRAGDCYVFISEIQQNIDCAKQKIKEKYNELEFHGAQEQITFGSYYSQIMTELEFYRTIVGTYHFQST
ncbi:MAG: hypothetical protein FWF33_05150 [Clostridiales bacterium]|nr:hypothetical protein [Clostridiales bacterium]